MKLPSLRSRADVTTNTGFFAYVIFRKGSKLQQENIQNIVKCTYIVNKTACEDWSGLDKVHFCVKLLTPFFHRTLQLFFWRSIPARFEHYFYWTMLLYDLILLNIHEAFSKGLKKSLKIIGSAFNILHDTHLHLQDL